jgi:hypothetical protein
MLALEGPGKEVGKYQVKSRQIKREERSGGADRELVFILPFLALAHVSVECRGKDEWYAGDYTRSMTCVQSAVRDPGAYM